MDTLKNRVRFGTTLTPETHEKLKELSAETMIPISRLVEMAISNLLESRNQKSNKNLE